MILSWLSRLVASLLVTVLCGAIITTVLDQTVLNSHYLDKQLAATNSYSRLSTGLSQQLAKQAGSVDPVLAAKLQGILTPAILQQKIQDALNQLQAYSEGKGPAPTINLTDLAAQAQAAGVPIDQESDLTKPITLGSTKQSNQTQQSGKNFGTIKAATMLASIVLAALLGFLSWRRHNYVILAHVLISVGITIGLLALFCLFVPSVADHFIKVSATSSAFTDVARNMVDSVAKDLGKRFGIIAGLCLVVGIGTRIWLTRMKPKPSAAPAKLSR